MIKCTPINYELCSFVKVAKLNKMCKCHTLVFATELIFDDNPKSSSTVPEIYCGARRGDANFLASIHKYIIPYRADISLDWGGHDYRKVTHADTGRTFKPLTPRNQLRIPSMS